MEEMGCDSLFSDCCKATSHLECRGMEVGDFVAVLTYTLNLFQPLNFLGSVYNALVMAVIDLTNLSELLAENPDVTDSPNAKPLPKENAQDPSVVVEFDNVVFHYPTQPSTKGLKGLSFKMKKGTTTAIVGPTGKYHTACTIALNLAQLIRCSLLVLQEPERQLYLASCSVSTMSWVVQSRYTEKMSATSANEAFARRLVLFHRRRPCSTIRSVRICCTVSEMQRRKSWSKL